jgi:hypothetical protein
MRFSLQVRFALALLALALCACARHEPAKDPADVLPREWQAERRYPPLVFQSKAS